MSPRFPGRLALQQRVLPSFRVPFSDMLAGACDRGLSVFAGQPRRTEAIATGLPRVASYTAAQNIHILGGSLYLCHQRGLTSWLEAWGPDALIMEANPRYLATGSGVRWMHARKRPVIGWGSFVGITDGPSWYRQFHKYPWEDPMEYAVRSPLHYVANVTTPTMVMTGEADLRTPIPQTEEFYRALKLLRKADTLMVRMPEEFHGWRRPTHQLLQQLYLMAWFEKYRTKESKEEVR